VDRLGSATDTLSAGLDADRQRFVETLGEVCVKTGWQVHAYVLMPNHFYLVVETMKTNRKDQTKNRKTNVNAASCQCGGSCSCEPGRCNCAACECK
jgi:REP element-mobilizing transposase RayT